MSMTTISTIAFLIGVLHFSSGFIIGSQTRLHSGIVRLDVTSLTRDGTSAEVQKPSTTVSDQSNNKLNFLNHESPISNGTDTLLLPVQREETKDNNSRQFTPLQKIVRATPVAIGVAYLIDPRPFDNTVASVWSAIYNWEFAQYPLFEAEVATFGFYWAIIMFSSLHLLLGPEKTRKNRVDGKLPQDPFSWIRPENWYEWFNPTFAYLGSIWLYLQIHEKPPLPELAPTFGVLVAETLFGVWLYDLCFFPIHYIMHTSKIGNIRKEHSYHHRLASKGTLNALETVQHSYVDGFAQVAINILVQHISPFGVKHTFSRLLHNLIVTYLLTEAHSGYNLPWMSHNVFPEVLGGAPRHERHHSTGRVYYQQYFKYLDDFFGFTEGENNDSTKGTNKKLKINYDSPHGEKRNGNQSIGAVQGSS